MRWHWVLSCFVVAIGGCGSGVGTASEFDAPAKAPKKEQASPCGAVQGEPELIADDLLGPSDLAQDVRYVYYTTQSRQIARIDKSAPTPVVVAGTSNADGPVATVEGTFAFTDLSGQLLFYFPRDAVTASGQDLGYPPTVEAGPLRSTSVGLLVYAQAARRLRTVSASGSTEWSVDSVDAFATTGSVVVWSEGHSAVKHQSAEYDLSGQTTFGPTLSLVNAGASAVAVDDSFYYWTTWLDDALWSMSRVSGASPVVIAQVRGASKMVRAGECLYTEGSEGLLRVHREGGAPALVVEPQEPRRDFLVDGHHVYFRSGPRLYRKAIDPP